MYHVTGKGFNTNFEGAHSVHSKHLRSWVCMWAGKHKLVASIILKSSGILIVFTWSHTLSLLSPKKSGLFKSGLLLEKYSLIFIKKTNKPS